MPTADQQNQLEPQQQSDTEIAATSIESAEEKPLFEGFAESDPGIDATPSEVEEEAEAADGETAPETPEPIAYRELSSEELQAAVEAVLFMNHKPVSVAKLRELIHPEIAEDDFRTAISNLMASYFDENRGIELAEVANGFQFRTKPANKDIIRRMYQIAPMKLTNAMLEVLAIVAYNQPCTREAVDQIRGVDSSHLLRVLLDKKMLRIAGKSDEVGKPMIYATSKEFLELFGLRDLGSLPTLRDIEEMLPKNEVGAISEEEALSQEMEGIVTASKPLEFNDLELEDLDAHEAQEIKEKPELPSLAHSGRGEKSNASTEERGEAGAAFDLSAETPRHLPLGPEGNA
jgi:segregation and condensation protein B